MKPIAITAGEPAGIGPDIVVQIAQQTLPVASVIFADKHLLLQRAQQLGLTLTVTEYVNQTHIAHRPGHLWVKHIPLTQTVQANQLDSAHAHYVLQTLTAAGKCCLQQAFSAVVTGPVHKQIIQEAGVDFTGHTEFFAALTGTPQVVMLLVHDNLRIALATTHLPLRQVADAIDSTRLTQTITLLRQGLRQDFGIQQPRILVSGLNPHAGEGGCLGWEEQEIIQPVVQQCQQRGWHVEGPLSADTLFMPEYRGRADAYLMMYHDQGLPVIKYAGFGQVVNVTLGLPIVRTSVDHGTALGLAGTGQANPDSLIAAIDTALGIIQHRDQTQ